MKNTITKWMIGQTGKVALIHDDIFPEQVTIKIGTDNVGSAAEQAHSLNMNQDTLAELIKACYDANYRLEVAVSDRLRAEAQAEEQGEEDALSPASDEDTAAYLARQGVVTEADPF